MNFHRFFMIFHGFSWIFMDFHRCSSLFQLFPYHFPAISPSSPLPHHGVARQQGRQAGQQRLGRRAQRRRRHGDDVAVAVLLGGAQLVRGQLRQQGGAALEGPIYILYL